MIVRGFILPSRSPMVDSSTPPRYTGPRALAESLSAFAQASAPDARWDREGLRDDAEYRDLGLAAATHGRIGVKHIRALKPLPAPTGWHWHASRWYGRRGAHRASVPSSS